MRKFSNMAEFAAYLGLSRCTVSFILNDKWRIHNISPKTAKRVLDLAEKYQFTPNYLGLAINGKIKIDVAILLPKNVYDHHREAFFRLIDIIDANGLKYLIMQLGDDKNNRLLIERLHNFRIDKAVVIAAPLFTGQNCYDWWLQTTRKNPEIRFLLYDYRTKREQKGLDWPENVHITGFDAGLAYESIVEYIAAAGYTSFHLFNASKLHPAVRHSQKIGLKAHAHGKIVGETSLFGLGERIGAQLAKLPNPRRVAVFIGDDTVTISTVKYLLERGFRVPENFAFISWDGLAISEYFLRTVTTLEIPHTKMLSYAKNFVTGKDCEQSLIVTPIIRVGETMPQKKCMSP